MRLKELKEDGIDVFALEGDIDLHYSPSLRTVLHGKTRTDCPALILDLSGVSYIDSSGLAVFMEYLRDAANRGAILCLASASKDVNTIFEVVRLDKVIPLFPSVADAIAAIRSNSVQPRADLFN